MTREAADSLKRLYKETSEFLVIGLTGRTGSGCSTAADILSSSDPILPESSKIYGSDNDKRKYQIIRNFVLTNWKPFTKIKIREVITRIILDLTFDDFCRLVASTLSKFSEHDVCEKLGEYKNNYVKH